MKTKKTVYAQSIVPCRTLCPYTETAHRKFSSPLLREIEKSIDIAHQQTLIKEVASTEVPLLLPR